MTSSSQKTTTESEYLYALTGPEVEVAEIIRLAHMRAFSLTIKHRDDEFTVRLIDSAARKFIEGRGATFEAAWRALPGAETDLDFAERIAAFGTGSGASLVVIEGGR